MKFVIVLASLLSLAASEHTCKYSELAQFPMDYVVDECSDADSYEYLDNCLGDLVMDKKVSDDCLTCVVHALSVYGLERRKCQTYCADPTMFNECWHCSIALMEHMERICVAAGSH